MSSAGKEVANKAVGFLLFAILGAVGLTALEDYIPTDPTLIIVWPISGVLYVLGAGLSFL